MSSKDAEIGTGRSGKPRASGGGRADPFTPSFRPIARMQIAVGAAVVVAIVWLVTGLLVWQYRATVVADGERRAASLARVLEEQTALTVQAVDLTLVGIVDTLRHAPNLPVHDPDFQDTLRQKLKSLPYVRALFVIGKDGYVTQDTDDPFTPHVSLADRPYFRVHRDNPQLGLHVGIPLISRSVGVWFVSMSRRIESPDGSFGGIVVAAVEPRYFERFYADLPLGEADSISLFERNGLLLARNPPVEKAIGTSFIDSDLFHNLAKSDEGIFRVRSGLFDRSARIIAYRSLEGFPFVVTVALDQQTVLATWAQTAWAAATACGIFAALVGALTFLFVRFSEQREAARLRLEQAQRLEALGQLTGGIAHDFNNVLTIVGGNLEMALERSGGEEKLRRSLETSLRAVARGTRLASQLLGFARRQELRIASLDVNTLLTELRPLLEHAAGKGIEVQFQPQSGIWPCRTDEAQFGCSMINLVLNAAHAMPGGGRIRLTTSNCPRRGVAVESDTLAPGDYVCVTVTDEGRGMPPDVQRRALEPFYTTKGATGTGLGLSQVYGFVRQVGGDVRIKSAVGRGTSIRLYFPRAADAPAQPPDSIEHDRFVSDAAEPAP